LCASGILRSLCGVAAGAAKASLSAHFARNGNLAELNAKDGSQETVISLMGMLVGSLFVRVVEGRTAVWISMLILVGIHLGTNYKAVRAVQMRTINRQRAQIIVSEYERTNRVLQPAQVAEKERILTWKAPPIMFARTFPQNGQITLSDLRAYQAENYVVAAGTTKTIFLKERATPRDALKAYVEALASGETRFDEEFWKELSSAGWNLQTGAVEIGQALRIVVE
jgi:hypothetical protein